MQKTCQDLCVKSEHQYVLCHFRGVIAMGRDLWRHQNRHTRGSSSEENHTSNLQPKVGHRGPRLGWIKTGNRQTQSTKRFWKSKQLISHSLHHLSKWFKQFNPHASTCHFMPTVFPKKRCKLASSRYKPNRLHRHTKYACRCCLSSSESQASAWQLPWVRRCVLCKLNIVRATFKLHTVALACMRLQSLPKVQGFRKGRLLGWSNEPLNVQILRVREKANICTCRKTSTLRSKNELARSSIFMALSMSF